MELKVTCCSCGLQFSFIRPLDNKTGLYICDKCSEKSRKKDFIKKAGELLAIAKPNLIKTEYQIGKEIENTVEWDRIISDEEYAVVTCENGYRYFVNITANSFCAIAEAIFHDMVYK